MKKREKNVVEESADKKIEENEELSSNIKQTTEEKTVETSNDIKQLCDEKDNEILEQLNDVKKTNKVLKGLLIVLLVSLVVGGCIGLGLMLESKILNKDNNLESTTDDNNDDTEKEDNNDESSDDEKEDTDNDKIDVEKFPFEKKEDKNVDFLSDSNLVKLSSITDVSKLYAVDINSGDDIVKYSGYDGYYIILDGDDYYLKRNQKIVSKIERNTLKLYKDNTDKDSKYIAAFCSSDLYSSCSLTTAVNGDYAYLSPITSNFIKSIILNINTGKYKIYDDAFIFPISGINEVIFMLESDKSIDIVSLTDFSLISSKEKDTFIIGDNARLSQGDAIHSKSSKYVVVKNNDSSYESKYGLYDYQMNKKIDFIYDDLNTISDDLLIAKKGGKFGVIDYANNIIIDFIYDGIEAVDDYYVVVKNGKLGVLYKDGKEVVPLDYDVSNEIKHSLRLCCGDINSFNTYKSNNDIIISYLDKNKPTLSFGGYDYSYIVLSKNGTYSDAKYSSRIYNYSDYYYYDINDSNLNIYDMNRTLIKTINCNAKSITVDKFVDKDVLKYNCGTGDKYYNIKQNKEILKNEVKNLDKTSIGSLYLITIDGKTGIYSYYNKLLLTLNKGDVFKYVHNDIYKLTKTDGTIEYYEFKKLFQKN